MPREYPLVLAVVIALLCAGCNSDSPMPTARPVPVSPTAPSEPPAPAPAPVPTVTGVTISGNLSFTRVGETSQLTATARLSDGTTKDVSSDPSTRWTSNDNAVFNVSTSGLVTIVEFGSAGVSVVYQNRATGQSVTATPAGTFVVAGWVREPGQSGVSGVRVTDTGSGRTRQTTGSGSYSVAQLPANQAHLRFEKEGFEPVEYDAKPTDSEVAIQHIIRLNAGDTVTPLQMAPHDLSYTIGSDRCYPCRLVRVMVPAAGTLHVKATWNTSAVFNLWSGGQFFAGTPREAVADVVVKTAGEIVVYLGTRSLTGGSGSYAPFTIATTFTP